MMYGRAQDDLDKLDTDGSGIRGSHALTSFTGIFIIVFALVIQNTALALLLKFSFREGAEYYSPSTVVLFSELIKFSLCTVVIIVRSAGDFIMLIKEIPKSPMLLIPATLYVIQNNLLFYGAKRLNPFLYLICTQMKILTTALASRFFLRHKVTKRQYVALSLLVCGIVAVQHDPQGLNDSTLSTSSGITERFFGIVAVLLASCTSGVAGVLLENIYKAVPSELTSGEVAHNVWTRNVQLSIISTPFALVGVLSDNVSPGNLLNGYDAVVIGVLLLQAVGGLIIALVMKLASNILKCMAICISICLCAIYSATIEGAVITLPAQFGIILVIFSIALYFTNRKASSSASILENK